MQRLSGRPSHGGCFWATGPQLPPESHHLDSGRALCKPSKNNTPQIKYLKGEGGGGDTAWGVSPFGKQRQQVWMSLWIKAPIAPCEKMELQPLEGVRVPASLLGDVRPVGEHP